MKRCFLLFILLALLVTLSACKANRLLGSWYVQISESSGNIEGIPEEMLFKKNGEVSLHNVIRIENGTGYLIREVIEEGSWKEEDGRITITGPHETTLVAFNDIFSVPYTITKASDAATLSAKGIILLFPNGASVFYNIEDSSWLYSSDIEIIDNR